MPVGKRTYGGPPPLATGEYNAVWPGWVRWYNWLMPVDNRVTGEDLCLLPEDGRRREIIDGDLFMTPAPLTLHQGVVSAWTFSFGNLLTAMVLGKYLRLPWMLYSLTLRWWSRISSTSQRVSPAY